MRHRLFLAVLLSLALGLLKETTAATEGEEPKPSTTVPTTSKNQGSNNQTVTTPAPAMNTTSNNTGNGNETVTTPAPSMNTTSNNTGSNNQTVTTPAPSMNTTSNNTGNGNETVTTPAPSMNTTSNNTGSNNQTVTTPAPSMNTTSNNTGNGNETVTTPAPAMNTTSNNTGSNNQTVTTPAPSMNTTSNNTGNGNETVTTPAPSMNTTSNNTGSNNQTVTTPAPSMNTTSNNTGNGNETVTTPAPSMNTTSNNTGSNNQTVTTPAPSMNTTSNNTGNGNETVTTPAPSMNTTSNNTGSNNETVTTPAPSMNTTSNNTGSNNQTVTTPAPTMNTTSNNTGSNNETVTTPAPSMNTTSKPPENFCSTEPCGRNFATCVPLKSNYTCKCKFGFYYSKEDKNCYKGDVYPGLISVKRNYSDNVEIVNSTEYEELFNYVSEFFQKALASLPGYEETVIVEIIPPENIRSEPRTDVKVINLFKENSDVNKTSVSDAVMQTINASLSYVSSYEVVKQCDVFQCDTRTSECVEEPVLECKCKKDLGKINQDDRSCLVCNESCSTQANKYCTIRNEIPACTCMINFEYRDGECTACQVGYSGEKCTDNTELILIIVGTVLGAVILILVIAVSVISARAKDKQNPEKKRLIKSEYSNRDISDDRSTMMFPRVQTTSGHANPGYQPNNPYEMPSTNRGHFSETGFDDLYEPSRERGGFRMQSRY